MKNSRSVAGNGLIVITAMAMTACATVKTNQVRIDYVPPKVAAHQQTYELMKERQSLEKLQEFLSPFRLEWPLNISMTECGGEADAMYSDDTISICYEYIDELRKNMPAKTTPAGIEPIDTLVGPFVDTVLHEFAHALFDYADIPILGREEDAADQVSAYIYLQLGKDEARRLIMGTAYTYFVEARDAASPSTADFAGEHGTPEQRAFNLLCMAYGADPELFEEAASRGRLPQERAEFCEEEYELISLAYEALIGPHIDPDLAKKVFDRSWLPSKTTSMLGARPQ